MSLQHSSNSDSPQPALGVPSPLAVQEWLVRHIAAACNAHEDEIDVHVPLTSLGLESVTLFTLAGDLAAWLEHDIPLTLLWDYPTIAAIAAHLGEHSDANAVPPSPCLVTLQGEGEEPPLFLVHDVSGTIWCYAALLSHMGKERPLLGLQFPLEDDNSFHLSQLEDLAAFYVKQLRQRQPSGPYYVGGFSMGGIVAFEMARQLKECGEEIALLALIDTYFPGLKHRPLSLHRKIRNHISNLRPLNWEGKVTYVRDRRSKSRRSPWPLTMTSEEQRFRDALFHSKVSARLNEAVRSYRASSYDGCITLLRARWQYTHGDDARSWRRVAQGGLKQHFLPTSHGMMVTEPYVRHLGALLQQCLRDATKHNTA
ncbi:MAG TPA: thioesterase domain-containing protein [Abditibacterium sp.]|jgi:thioesterase domain-containing protein/acyl carrier protein